MSILGKLRHFRESSQLLLSLWQTALRAIGAAGESAAELGTTGGSLAGFRIAGTEFATIHSFLIEGLCLDITKATDVFPVGKAPSNLI